jgi:steroid 5-alpha reductase family enzyme
VFDLNVYADGLAVGLGIGILAWLASIPRRDVSLVDSLWSLLFLAMAATYVALAPAVNERAYLLLFMVTVWAVRLSLFITLRNWGEPEDRATRLSVPTMSLASGVKSLYLVFGCRRSWPGSSRCRCSARARRPAAGMLDFAAVALWLVGFGFEAIGDQQLARFKADPANRGKVLDRGLWRYTRHPNYFGEACIWWAYYLFAAAPVPGGPSSGPC